MVIGINVIFVHSQHLNRLVYQYILSQFTLETKLVANYVILLQQGRNIYPGMSKTFMMQILSSNQTYIAKNATIKQRANIH